MGAMPRSGPSCGKWGDASPIFGPRTVLIGVLAGSFRPQVWNITITEAQTPSINGVRYDCLDVMNRSNLSMSTLPAPLHSWECLQYSQCSSPFVHPDPNPFITASSLNLTKTPSQCHTTGIPLPIPFNINSQPKIADENNRY